MNKLNQYPIRKLHNDELNSAFSLIWDVFRRFVAPDYTSEGITYFYDQFIANQNFRDDFLNNLQTIYGAFDNEKLIGILSISKSSHVSCVFVDENYHRQGIATLLFGKVISELKHQGVEKITLNASPYAAPFYHAIGFADTGTESLYHGIRYTPMELYLINFRPCKK